MECSIHFHERVDLSRTVGAVYDRAFGPRACESCAVIDRAYSVQRHHFSKNWNLERTEYTS